jgi:hypothetical protein
MDDDLKKINALVLALKDVNALREELIKLSINPDTRLIYENEIYPLLKTLESLSLSSYDFSTAAKNLASINISSNSKVKDAVKITDSIDKLSKDVFKVLKSAVEYYLSVERKIVENNNCK